MYGLKNGEYHLGDILKYSPVFVGECLVIVMRLD